VILKEVIVATFGIWMLNRWISGLCPLSGILNARRHMFQKLDLFLSSGEV
jgi:hypothetical protein